MMLPSSPLFFLRLLLSLWWDFLCDFSALDDSADSIALGPTTEFITDHKLNPLGADGALLSANDG